MDQTEAIYETLIKKGWSFRDPEEIKPLIQTQNSLESTESELLAMDLRSIGAKSLPDPTSLRKSSHLSGPKVLQLVSLRDIYKSSIDASFKNSQRRLLRFVLTDGQSDVTAIEYAPIPSISEEIPPGTKICLENKVSVRNGILCLSPKVVTIVGGIVPSLYEEWQMSQKYSGFSRSSLRLSQNENGVGPPAFEKLQVESHRHQAVQQHGSHVVLLETTSKYPSNRQTGGHQGCGSNDPKADKASEDAKTEQAVDDPKPVSSGNKAEEKPCTSEARPKEVSEAVPVQNQAAAQKLLQKMAQPAQGDRNYRGHRNKFKGKQEETQVFTLEEWERRKGNNLKPIMAVHSQDITQDEEFARQLQNQLDIEDFHVEPMYTEAEKIRMSMFSFGGPDESRSDGRKEFRGRGRGRGRGRRGRGRFS
ncbi:uncharacterized protein A4U43_C06F9300 [Asparagus officinalis]|uniref:RecQ mediated genome instability protein 1 OB-fold domain-containing protein n=1 Tax=Asparagus officinalis TaxID=4686 RepID=A0A5P1EKM2_ASPOF|nr:tudor domain-containing protein 3 [Asparagus officinalis]XP_020270101.1 tudor domain-containing protein 3 [Asparagus officinalis]ONK66545.1 uncharacterized protein A4U43_C06F9300 [Asparagus officinalis]